MVNSKDNRACEYLFIHFSLYKLHSHILWIIFAIYAVGGKVLLVLFKKYDIYNDYDETDDETEGCESYQD